MSLSMRLIKISMVASIALFFSLIAFNNLIDFRSNFLFVQHVLSMDTTFHEPSLIGRSITNPNLQKYAYDFIIAWEVLTAIVCWVGVIKLFLNIKESPSVFNRSRQIAFLGLFFGFLLYMVGFIVIGGEWFSMWQSHLWNGQMKAGLFINLIMFVMIFLQQREDV